MVKKLMKYEIASYLRSLLPFQLILLGIAVLHRFVQFFESDSSAYAIFSLSSTVIFVIACSVAVVATVALCISRFYKNMFTGEGYLSFTLPVTVHQHIWAKLLTAILCDLATVFSILLACSVVTCGEAFVEVCKAISFIAGKLHQKFGGHFIAFIPEVIVLVIVFSAITMLLFYTCISIGQLAKKNRVLLAFGVYFGYYVLRQLLGTVEIVILTVNGGNSLVMRFLGWVVHSSIGSVHVVFAVLLGGMLLLGAVYYLITQHIMKKKLNLE